MNAKTSHLRLLVEGIELVGHHGVYPEERDSGTRFRVDLAIDGDLEAAASSDDIADTIDYEDVVQLVGGINRRHRFNLIESFAGALADGLLSRYPRIERVIVRVRKPAPQNMENVLCAVAEVTKRRT
jgi:dihydroneopterin aldolase